MLLEENLQILHISLFIHGLEIFLWQLVLVREEIRIHNKNVVDTIHPSLTEVVDKEVSLFLQLLPVKSGFLDPKDLVVFVFPSHMAQTGYMMGLPRTCKKVKAL